MPGRSEGGRQGDVRPDGTGPAGDSRARIAEAARRLFAAQGYERTTVRAVAAAARIDPAMVIRHFGSKEGLFAAVAEVDLRLPDLAGLAPAVASRLLVEHFLRRWEEGRGDGLVLLLRSAVSNEPARQRLRRVFAEQVVRLVAGIVPDPAEAARRAELLGSQMIGLAVARHVIGLPQLSGAATGWIVDGIAPVVERHLFGPAAGEGSGGGRA